MEHLALEIFDLDGKGGSKYAWLPEDASITITDTSEIFASGDVWSHSFTLNTHANAHIFGTAGEIHGSRLHEQINKRRARLWVEGLPLYLGYLKLDDEVDVDENGDVDVIFESGQKTFEDMIEGAKANQVPMMGDVKFGVALWRKRWVKLAVKLKATVEFADGATKDVDLKNGSRDFVIIEADGDNQETPTLQYPRMVFPKGEFFGASGSSSGVEQNPNGNFGGEATEVHGDNVDCLNTDYPYAESENGTPTHPYCNVALCYQKYGFERTNDNGETTPEYDSEPEAQRGYEYMPANRVNSAPNFFVLYWLRCLMKHLNIYIEENQMLNVEDLRRLFFVNTNCAYILPTELRGASGSARFGKYTCGRGVGIRDRIGYIPERIDKQPFVDPEESKIFCTYEGTPTGSTTYFSDDEKTIKQVTVEIAGVEDWGGHGDSPKSTDYLWKNDLFHDAIATSDCFPNVDIAEVIEAIESGFGVRFLFSSDYKRVRIVLLRDIFRNGEVQDIACDITASTKQENSIRGFRMTYGNTEDTHFYYKGFADKMPHQKTLWPDTSDTHDYSQWNLSADYASIIKKVSAFDKTCYVTPNTGNAYGIKIDENAKRFREFYPSVFGFAGFMDAEDGDCTGEEETIKTINVGFTPAIMNDLNMEEERGGSTSQRFALFVDETMRPRRPDLKDGTDYNASDALYNVNGQLYAQDDDGNYVNQSMMADNVVKPGEFSVRSDVHVSATGLSAQVSREIVEGYPQNDHPILSWNLGINIDGYVNEGYRLYLQDNYAPNDDGVPPIETHDWGLTLGIMRGSGSDAHVEYTGDTRDGEGNKTWEIITGSSVTAHPDTCDDYGQEWDYNGDGATISDPTAAAAELATQFPNSNAPFNSSGKGYINSTGIYTFDDGTGKALWVMLVTSYSVTGKIFPGFWDFAPYCNYLNGHSAEEMMQLDRAGYNGLQNLIVEIGSTDERKETLLKLCRIAYGGSSETIKINNGIGTTFGRVSLKLRAEKPNPYYDANSTDADKKKRYLEITNPNLRGRGLADQFYKEYSYWIRNARIEKKTVRMELAQLLRIDKTKRVTVGDVKGFINKMQYSVSNKTGLGEVTMEIMYI